MWSSRDISLVIITAVVVFVFSVLVFQLGNMLTGLLGVNYIFTFGMALVVSLTFLLFEGRKGRFFVHNLLVMILSLPTFLGGEPFNVLTRLIVITAGLPADLILNHFYGYFKAKGKLLWWAILTGMFFFLFNPFLQILLFPLLFPPEFVELFTSIVITMIPFIVGGSIIGGFLGYKVYQRIT